MNIIHVHTIIHVCTCMCKLNSMVQSMNLHIPADSNYYRFMYAVE